MWLPAMLLLGVLVVSLESGALTARHAEAQSQAPARRAVEIRIGNVTVECDDTGAWLQIYSMAEQEVASGERRDVVEAQERAAGRAATQLVAFFRQDASAESVVTAIREGIEANQGGADALSPDARRRLGVELVEAIRGYSSSRAPLPLRGDRGFDTARKVAWAKVGIFSWRANVPGSQDLGNAGRTQMPEVESGPTTPAPVRVGGSIKEPARIRVVPPVYPPAARSAGVSGAVVLEVTIGTDGKVLTARVVKSIPQLDQAAVDAVTQWQFAPTLVEGTAVPVVTTVTVTFK